MLRKIISATLITATMVCASTQNTKNENKLIEELQQLPLLNSKFIEIKKAKTLTEGWYHLEALNNNRKVNFFTDKEVLIMGEAFNIKNGKPIKFEVDTQKFKSAAAFTVGNGKDEYFLFTDPECPYCKNFDEIMPMFKDDAKIHVYLFPLSFHIAAEGMSKYVLSNPKESREKALRRMLTQPLATSLKEIDFYNNSMYSTLLEAIKSKDKSQMDRYAKYIAAFKTAFKISSTQDIAKILEDKISSNIKKQMETTSYKNIEQEFSQAMLLANKEFNVGGTPSVYNNNGDSIGSPNSLLQKYNITNLNAIKEIANSKYSIKAGKGKEPLYLFTSTQCPHCISQFQDYSKIEKLYEKYKVHFILMATGNGQKAFNDMMYLFSIEDNNKRLEKFEALIRKKENIPSDFKIPDKNSAEVQKIGREYFGMLRNTYITGTPTAIDKNGNKIIIK